MTRRHLEDGVRRRVLMILPIGVHRRLPAPRIRASAGACCVTSRRCREKREPCLDAPPALFQAPWPQRPLSLSTAAPGALAVNYAVNVVRFTVVREAPTVTPRTLSAPDAVAALARDLIPDDAREHFGIFMLNARNGLVGYHEVSTGTLSASLVHPREVFGPALRLLGVASLILVYNHPSGDPDPSREDLGLTRQLVDAGRLLDLTVHDHVVIGNGSGAYVSLAGRGLM